VFDFFHADSPSILKLYSGGLLIYTLLESLPTRKLRVASLQA
jgi:hypothetical protein